MNTSPLLASPYPDLLSPRAFPALLAQPGYDPFGLMPPDPLPAHPRAFLSPALLAAARGHIRSVPWAKISLARLLANCGTDADIPATLPAPQPDPALNNRLLGLAQRNALAFLLLRRAGHRRRALRLFRLIADFYPRWPVTRDACAVKGGLAESRFLMTAGYTYDLLAAAGLDPADDARFRALLAAMLQTASRNSHHTCGNHNTWHLAARLAAAAALGDRAQIHHALYGAPDPHAWRYGLIHQFRHDFLPDGPHWEQSIGYHFYTLMAVTEALCTLDHLGVHAWQMPLPAQHHNDGADLHRAYGPIGFKTIQSAFDTPFFQTFPNGDLPLLHDSGLANLRGVHIWGILFNKAWEACADPKYAWLLNRMEAEHPRAKREFPGLPMPLQTHMGDVDFARLRDAAYPRARYTPPERTTLSIAGRYAGHCSLFPVAGAAFLRSHATRPEALGAYCFWGPHWAGHMNPAALHLELWARGRRITATPRSGGYDDPLHLAWNRTTIAHNTVTVNETPMFPYDIDNPSLWETDSWRDSRSDGRLEGFQPEPGFKVLRVSNEAVYPGVRLDRTVLVTSAFMLDAFRVQADAPRRFDWAAHALGALSLDGPVRPAALPDRPGYRLFRDVVQLRAAPRGRPVHAAWSARGGRAHVTLLPPPGAAILAAVDPEPEPAKAKPLLGQLEPPEPAATLLVRTRGRSALFLALWSFSAKPAVLTRLAGSASTDLLLETSGTGRATRWRLPADPAHPVRLL